MNVVHCIYVRIDDTLVPILSVVYSIRLKLSKIPPAPRYKFLWLGRQGFQNPEIKSVHCLAVAGAADHTLFAKYV